MDDTHIFRSQDRHKSLLAHMAQYRGLETKGFWKSLDRLAEDEDWFEAHRKQPFRPDAFKIDREARVVEIHEAVVTHPPSRRALLSMGCLWFDLDCEEWDLCVYLHRADQIAPVEIDMLHWYLQVVHISAAKMRATRLNAEGADRG